MPSIQVDIWVRSLDKIQSRGYLLIGYGISEGNKTLRKEYLLRERVYNEKIVIDAIWDLKFKY